MSELDEAQELTFSYLARSLRDLAWEATSNHALLTTIAYYYRLRGIGAYLRSGDERAFVSDLYNAGQARLEYLRSCAASGLDDGNYRTAVKNLAYFDALAVHDLATATELATACAGRWNSDTQYEDDFLWMEFLQAAVIAPETEASLLERYRDVADGSSPFFMCCQALHDRDAQALRQSLGDIVDIRQANFAAKRDPPDLPVLILATEPYLDVQALATCRVGQHRGMSVPIGVRSIPEPLLEMPRERISYPGPGAWRLL